MKLHAAVRMSAHLRVPETELWERVGPGTESQGPLRCDWVLPCHQNQCQNILTIHHNAAESSDELQWPQQVPSHSNKCRIILILHLDLFLIIYI